MTVIRPHVHHRDQKDKYFVLKSFSSWSRECTLRGRTLLVEPVTSQPCDFDQWHRLPMLARRMRELKLVDDRKIHGRRFNDEVELFGIVGDDGAETPGIRADLERAGFKVRMYVDEPQTRRYPRPGTKALMRGKDGEEGREEGEGGSWKTTTLRDRCLETLTEAVSDKERETGTSIAHGWIVSGTPKDTQASSPSPPPKTTAKQKQPMKVAREEKKKKLLLARVSEDHFHTRRANDQRTFHWTDFRTGRSEVEGEYEIVGDVRDSSPAFLPGGGGGDVVDQHDGLRAFFHGDGKLIVPMQYRDVRREEEQAAKEEYKARKKEEKRLRRRESGKLAVPGGDASSTVVDVDAGAVRTTAGDEAEDEAGQAKRRREKQKAKKKRQQERRTASGMLEAGVSTLTVISKVRNGDSDDSSDEGSGERENDDGQRKKLRNSDGKRIGPSQRKGKRLRILNIRPGESGLDRESKDEGLKNLHDFMARMRLDNELKEILGG